MRLNQAALCAILALLLLLPLLRATGIDNCTNITSSGTYTFTGNLNVFDLFTPCGDLTVGECENQAGCILPTCGYNEGTCALHSECVWNGTACNPNECEGSVDFPDNCIDIQANDVVLDCQGYYLNGTGYGSAYYSSNGIYAYRDPEEATNITVQNCTVKNFLHGMYFYGVDNSTFNNLTLSDNNDVSAGDAGAGLVLYYSSYNNLTNIVAESNLNMFNCQASGIDLYWDSNYNLLENITANNNQPYGIYISTSYNNLKNITASGNVLAQTPCTGGGVGVYLDSAYYNNLTDINTSDNEGDGMFIAGDFNNCTNITATSNGDTGIYVAGNSNIFTNINASSNTIGYGLYLYLSNTNRILNCTANNNTAGVGIESSAENNFTNVTANNNLCEGVSFYDTDAPSYSNIINNSVFQFNQQGSTTNWYSGVYFMFTGTCTAPNQFYNNLFNNSLNFNNTDSTAVCEEYWNTTKQNGTRIYGNGTEVAGNFWTHPDGECQGTCTPCADITNDTACNAQAGCGWNIDLGQCEGTCTECNTFFLDSTCSVQLNCSWNASVINHGYSDICEDINYNGFCDEPYDILNDRACSAGINCSNNTDYFPLSLNYSGNITKQNTTLTLSASTGWSIPKGYADTLGCSSSNGEVTAQLYVAGSLVTNPYTFTPQITVSVVCNCSATTNYNGASVSQTLTVTTGGSGGSSGPGPTTNNTGPSTNQTITQPVNPPSDKLWQNIQKLIDLLPLSEAEKQYILAFLRAIYDILIATILGIPVWFILLVIALLVFLASIADKRELRGIQDIPYIGIFTLFIAAFLTVMFVVGPLVEV